MQGKWAIAGWLVAAGILGYSIAHWTQPQASAPTAVYQQPRPFTGLASQQTDDFASREDHEMARRSQQQEADLAEQLDEQHQEIRDLERQQAQQQSQDFLRRLGTSPQQSRP